MRRISSTLPGGYWWLHNKCPNFQTPGLKPKAIFNLIPGLKAGAPTLRRKRRNGTLLVPGLNKGLHSICYSSCENKTSSGTTTSSAK